MKVNEKTITEYRKNGISAEVDGQDIFFFDKKNQLIMEVVGEDVPTIMSLAGLLNEIADTVAADFMKEQQGSAEDVS